MLCQVCRKVFEGNFHSPKHPPFSQPHHKSVTDLYEAALIGRPVCMGIFGGFVEQYWERYYYCADDATAEDKTRMFIEDLSSGTNFNTESFSGASESGLVQKHELASSVDLSIPALSKTSIIQYHLRSPDEFATCHSLPSSKEPTLSFSLNEALVPKSRRIPRQTWRHTPAGKVQIYVFFVLSPVQEKTILPESQQSIENLDWPLYLGKHWLKDCLENHSECRLLNMPTWLPTRLLELDAPKTGFLRMIHTQAAEKLSREPYITLSHCWGHIALLKLEKNTLSQLSAGIEVSILPQTFQDAVKVTLLLGVKYLWIGFLCIFQDSKDDWTREAGLMGSVYLNGLCNIAATAAKDGNSGLLCKRRTPIIQDVFTNSTWGDATNHHWRVRLNFFLRSEFLDGPLLYRGWVVQERIMARRVLHFGTRQLYWECQKLDACETYPDGNPLFGPTYPEKSPYKSRHHNGLDIISKTPIIQFHLMSDRLRFWRQVLCAYSECHLTREEDKLVAISGLAKAFQKSLGDIEYLAGLWRTCLIQDLCWGLNAPGKRPKQYRAPSWSWASVDGIISDLGHRGIEKTMERSIKTS